MKLVRFSGQEHEAGFAVWQLCDRFYLLGECEFSLACGCVASDGGPLQSVYAVFPQVQQALDAAEVVEAALGGVRDVFAGGVPADAEGVSAFLSIDPGDVPY